MLPHPPTLTMERLVGGVYNEQSMSLSHAWSLFSQSRAERALLRQNGHPGPTQLRWKGVVMSCRASPAIVDQSMTETTRTCAYLHLSLLVYPSHHHVDSMGAAVSYRANHRAVPPCWRTYSLSEKGPMLRLLRNLLQKAKLLFHSGGHLDQNLYIKYCT